jgi:hypothetical protein
LIDVRYAETANKFCIGARAGVPAHIVMHLFVMTELNKLDR